MINSNKSLDFVENKKAIGFRSSLVPQAEAISFKKRIKGVLIHLNKSGSRVLLGGGWPEMVMAKGMDKLARKTHEKKSLAIEASLAFLGIPTTTADTVGLDNVELISQLQAMHQEGGCTAGIDVIYVFVSTETKLGC